MSQGQHSIKGYLKDRRIWPLIAIVVVLALLDFHYGIHFGIEFVGGTQIPITLEHPVNVTAMTGLLSALQQRVSTFGLKQITVEGVGDSHVYLTIPSITPTEINQTIDIIQSQGTFQGVVNGKEAINGTEILKGSIGQLQPTTGNGSVTWAVTFFITESAAGKFAKIVFGQANQPLYMFLDRPTSTAILLNYSVLGNTSLGLTPSQSLAAMQNALRLNNNGTIQVVTVTNSNASITNAETFFGSSANKAKYKTVFASANINKTLINFLQSNNYTVKLESKANMTPTYTRLSVNSTVLNAWPAVGLLSSPVLNPSITNGSTGQSYEISGSAPTTLGKQQQLNYATNQTKTIGSILNGGALPVAIIAGTPTTIPPTLGQKFLYISAITGIVAVLVVSAFIVVRYRRVFLIAPILITTLMELFIIISIIGLVGTIDLAAVAGMIAVVGTGVDAQIIITDEMLGHGDQGGSAKLVMGNAFYIVWTDAALLIIAMLPLFFATSLVTVVGFSESTIIGALLGVLITRPAYSAILERHYAA
jgi:preprotein translocase subunit SecD